MPGIATTKTNSSDTGNTGEKLKLKKKKNRKKASQSTVGRSSSGCISSTAGNFLRSCWRGRRAAKPARGRAGLRGPLQAPCRGEARQQRRARRRVPGQRGALTAQPPVPRPRPRPEGAGRAGKRRAPTPRPLFARLGQKHERGNQFLPPKEPRANRGEAHRPEAPAGATRADRGREDRGTGFYLDATLSRSLGHLSGGSRRSPAGQARAGRREVLGLSPLSAPLPARRRGPARPVPSRGSGGRGRARRGRGGAGGSGRGAGAAPRCCRRSPRARAAVRAPPALRVPCARSRLRVRGDVRAREEAGGAGVRGKGSGGWGARPRCPPVFSFLEKRETERRQRGPGRAGRCAPPRPAPPLIDPEFRGRN